MRDEVMTFFLGSGEDNCSGVGSYSLNKFTDGLNDLRTHVASLPNVSTYYIDSSLHMFLQYSAFYNPLAEDTKLRRTVALKFLPPHLATENRERFLREAQAAAALNHPNICTVFEIDEHHGFLAMEFLEAASVREKIAARPLPLEEERFNYGEHRQTIRLRRIAVHGAPYDA